MTDAAAAINLQFGTVGHDHMPVGLPQSVSLQEPDPPHGPLLLYLFIIVSQANIQNAQPDRLGTDGVDAVSKREKERERDGAINATHSCR